MATVWKTPSGRYRVRIRREGALHCQTCHEDWAHTGGNRKVATLDGLRARVVSWSVHSGLHWGTEEISAVTRYLSRRFYQLVP